MKIIISLCVALILGVSISELAAWIFPSLEPFRWMISGSIGVIVGFSTPTD